jgi:hypothetical protein
VLDESPDFEPILRTLHDHGVEFIVVGGLAGTLQGVPVTTADVDVVHKRNSENVERLVSALRAINAYYWEHTRRRLEPEARTLLLPGHHLLATDFGRLDVLGQIGEQLGYDDLTARSEILEIGHGLTVRVLDLRTLREIKAKLGRPKDNMVLAVIDRTIEEIERLKGSAEPHKPEQA